MRISETISWPVTWPDRKGVAGRLVRGVGRAVVSTGFGFPDGDERADLGGAVVEDHDLPADPRAEVQLERLVSEGSDGVLRDVVLTQQAASIEGVPDLDLTRGVVVSSTTSEVKNPHRAAARWEMRVEIDGTSVILYGPWVTFAWLGHLARWPVPTAG